MTVYDSETGEKVDKPHRFKTFKIRKGSAVDRPAQEPAVAVMLMKRADDEGASPDDDGVDIRAALVAKFVDAALTAPTNGHTHLLDLNDPSGFTSWEVYGSEGEGHSHPFVVDGGVAKIGEVAGHSHEVEAKASKSAGDGATYGDPMTDPKTPDAVAAEKAAERITVLEADLAASKALASMTDAQKAHYQTLEGDAAKDFLALDVEKRETIVEAAKSADAVVYTSKTSGEVFRKSDDARLVTMAKREDEREVETAKLREESEVKTYKARAKVELAHLAGEEATHVALLKAVDGIEDEALRGKVLESIHANDAGVAEGYARKGVTGDGTGGDAEAKLEAMAKKRAEEKGETPEKAYAEVTKTAEGKVLLAETLSAPAPAVQA